MRRCPYYLDATDEKDVYGKITGADVADTQYYKALSTYAGTVPSTCAAFGGGTVASSFAGFGCGTASAYGSLLQLSSQFPGRGPCYPVYFATTPYFNRRVISTAAAARRRGAASGEEEDANAASRIRAPPVSGVCAQRSHTPLLPSRPPPNPESAAAASPSSTRRRRQT